MVTRVVVEPALLAWAQERSGRTHGDFHTKFDGWDEWTAGRGAPTLHQLEDVARYAHLPFGLFFLPEPPQTELPIPDYCNGPDSAGARPSLDLLAVIDTSPRRQDWFRDYAMRAGIGPALIARVDGAPDAAAVAGRALRDLGYTVPARSRMTREGARNHLRRGFEVLGGLAVFTGMVGNDTHRMLQRTEFRGFTLDDDVAPLIFVNTHDDTLAGQIFTFFHEYAHVVRRQSGVSQEDLADDAADATEHWCNQVAAEALVPRDDLIETFRDEATPAELDRLARRYLCSTLVILLQLRRANLLPAKGFQERYTAESERVEAFARAQTDEQGGNFYANQPFRVGEKLSRAVLADLRAGGTTHTEAFGLLGLRNSVQVDRYAQLLHVG